MGVLLECADPLVIEAEKSRYGGSAWTRDYFENGPGQQEDGEFLLPVAPDRLHKENTSGGEPYGIILPDARVDGLFVSYLNLVFSEGGFPWPTEEDGQDEVRQHLADGLLPL